MRLLTQQTVRLQIDDAEGCPTTRLSLAVQLTITPEGQWQAAADSDGHVYQGQGASLPGALLDLLADRLGLKEG